MWQRKGVSRLPDPSVKEPTGTVTGYYGQVYPVANPRSRILSAGLPKVSRLGDGRGSEEEKKIRDATYLRHLELVADFTYRTKLYSVTLPEPIVLVPSKEHWEAPLRRKRAVEPGSATFSTNEKWFLAKLGNDIWKFGVLEFLLPRRSQFRWAQFRLALFARCWRGRSSCQIGDIYKNKKGCQGRFALGYYRRWHLHQIVGEPDITAYLAALFPL